MNSAIVIGGGIAGLAAAHRLQAAGVDVRVLDAGAWPGGVIRSTRADGYLVEHGPNALQHPPPALAALLGTLGLDEALVPAAPAARHRYVVRDGRPVALPSGPRDLLTTPLLSRRGRLRLLREPFVGRARRGDEESIADFVRRRLGPEVLAYAVDPFVAGIYAGDPETLSVRHAFPRLHALERAHGSLLRGALRGRRAATQTAPALRGLFSFPEGLGTLPAALARTLGDRLHARTTAVGLARSGPRWTVAARTPDGPSAWAADAVVYAAPLHRFAALGFDAGAEAAPLHTVPHPPVRVVALGFRREDVAHALDGFGLLVPSAEHAFHILGVLFSSSVFPGRAPEGHVLLTAFVGGTRRPDLAHGDEAAVEAVVRADLAALLGARGEPTFRRQVYWPHAIPQYDLGHGRVLEALDTLEARHPGLVFAGSYRRGVSVAAAAASGHEAALRIMR